MDSEMGYGLRLCAAIMAGLFVLLSIPVYYYAVFSRVKHNLSYQHGRGYASNLQGGILSWAAAVLVAYVVLPAATQGRAHSDSHVEFEGFRSFFFGVFLFAASVGVWYTHNAQPRDKWRYQYVLAGGVFTASLGLLSQGVPWMLYRPSVPVLGVLGLAGSLALLACCEMMFLSRNGWRFLPTHPK